MESIAFLASSFTVGFAYFELQQWIPAMVAIASTSNAIIEAEDMTLRRDAFRAGGADLEGIKRDFEATSPTDEKREDLVNKIEEVALRTQRRVLSALDTATHRRDHVAASHPSFSSLDSGPSSLERRNGPQRNVGAPMP
eukprot:COSAG02_NODE_1246_length_13659_cov_23.906858_6_plen_139_part_00